MYHDRHHSQCISLHEAFEHSLEKLFPEQQGRELRGGRVNPMKTICRERISIIGLKHKHQKRVIIFMSFHNVNTSHGREVRDTMASKFCELVATMRDLTGSVVVAGADLNCTNINNRVAVIPSYDTTLRRKRKDKIDYFILASPSSKVPPAYAPNFDQAGDDVVYLSVVVNLPRQWPAYDDYHISADVYALDFVQDQDSPLYPVVRDLLREKTGYCIDDYDKSLDHDPLICDLRVKSH